VSVQHQKADYIDSSDFGKTFALNDETKFFIQRFCTSRISMRYCLHYHLHYHFIALVWKLTGWNHLKL